MVMIQDSLIKKILREATTDSGSRGSYLAPLRPGLRIFDKTQLDPFNIDVSKYDSPLLSYDSYDGKMSETKKQIKKIEKKAESSSKYAKKHPVANDDDGDNINPFPNKINEDLAVWFGKKKKPKGSSQPKGPWVDICRKVDGKHPPCGRSDTSKGAYPKCRAAGVAGKMSDSQKRSACQQKRRAEKKDTQTGKGQKPVMTSYKPKKKLKEDMRQQIITLTESDIMKIVRRVLKEQNIGDDVSNLGNLSMKCIAYNSKTPYNYDLDGYTGKGKVEETGYGLGFNIIRSSNTPMDSVAGDSSQPVLVELEDMSVELRDYLIGRFPKNPITGEEIDWSTTAIDKKVIYVKNLVSSFKFACKVDEQRTNPNWIPFFKDTAYNLPIA
jgi:hypothetical protein